MKILYVLSNYDYFLLETNKIGGHISHITGVIDALQKKGHKVIVCSYDKIPFYNLIIQYKLLKRYDLKIPKIKRIYRDYTFCNQLLGVIKSVKPDVVYVRWASNLFWNWVFKKKNYKLIFECNSPLSIFLGKDISKINRIKKFIAKRIDIQIYKSADVISAVSKEVKDFLINNICSSMNEKIIVNPNGVNCDNFMPVGDDYREKYRISKDDVMVGFSGNFGPWQGIEILINAFQSLDKKKYNHTKLLIVGTGDETYVHQLKRLAEKERVDDVIFTGAVPFDKMPAYLRTCDILVSPQVPSIGKVFHQSPVKLYEYMAIGRAVIASNIGQNKKVIKDGYNGVLFEYGKIDSLASKLKLLVKDKSFRERISRNARIETVNKHSWINNVERFLAVIGKGNR